MSDKYKGKNVFASICFIFISSFSAGLLAKESCNEKLVCVKNKDGVLCSGKDYFKKIASNIGLKVVSMQGVSIDSAKVTIDSRGRVIIDDPDFVKSVEMELERINTNPKIFDNGNCTQNNGGQCTCINVKCPAPK